MDRKSGAARHRQSRIRRGFDESSAESAAYQRRAVVPDYPIRDKAVRGAETDLDGSGKLGGTASTEFPFIVPDNSPAVCENIIDPLLDGEFFVIWQNRHKNLRATNEAERGASAYQIAGLFNGLTLSAGSCEKYSDDTLSGWAITLKEEKAPRSAMFLNAGSLAATEALIKTMLTPSAME